MNPQRSDLPGVPRMGVRARAAEWPPRPKDAAAALRPFPRPSRAAAVPAEPPFPAPLRQRSSSEATLSECDGDEAAAAAAAMEPFREYGSTSSIDAQGLPEPGFCEMLNELRGKRGRDDKERPRRRGGGGGGGAGGGGRSEAESIFKKLRGGGGGRHEAEAAAAEEARGGCGGGGGEAGGPWLCRKGFAHFDVQSLLFEAVAPGAAGAQRRNTTTGASAASAGAEPPVSASGGGGAEDLNCKENLERDLGDNTSNELLLSCPHFRNEIGGGCGERDVSFSSSASPAAAAAPGPLWERGHLRPSNGGVSVLEVPREQQRDPERLRSFGVEHADLGARYYRQYFHGKEHSNYFGVDEKLGPVAVSVRRERLEEPSEHGPQFQQRLILRTSQLVTLRGSILEDATPSSSKAGSVRGIPVRDVLEFVVPELSVQSLRLALPSPKVQEQLLKLDEQGLCRRHKVGILYCKAGQSSEEEMYNNEAAGPALDEFLTLLGEKVSLKSFTKYAAQLDTKTDSTGTHSLYTTYQDYEIMFHVSTMLPYTPNNRQQLLRKRHIGNDIVTIIFQEPGALPFTPQNIRSHFQHVFIIVRAHQPCSDNVSYSVAVTRSKDVPPFGPPVPPSGVTFRRSDLFRAFLLAKAINGENAAHKSHKFRTMATRTRQEYLRDLAENYVTSTPLETAGKFNLISLASKKKEKSKARPLAELESAGAVSWRVWALDFGRGGAEVACALGISKEFVVLVDLGAKEVVFNCFTGDVIGWSAEGAALRIYHGRGDLVSVRAGAAAEGAEGAAAEEEVKEIVQRLKATTPGCATVDMTLRRNGLGQLGFHVHPDGSVAEVEEYGFAWQAGLRRGSRLLEVCKVAAVALSHEQMIDLLRTSVTVTVVIVPPHEDGTPRRGWSETLALPAEPEPFPEPFPEASAARAPFRSGPGWHRGAAKRAPAAPGAAQREPGHGKRPLSFPDSPLCGSSAFRQPSGSFSAPGSARGGSERLQKNSGNLGNLGSSGHTEGTGAGQEGGAERVKAEPLWHVPAPARIPGKRPARPEPGGKDSPKRLPQDPSPSPRSSSASSEAEGGASDGETRRGRAGPKPAPNPPKPAPNPPKTAPNPPKTAPNPPNPLRNAPKNPQNAPGAPQNAPKGAPGSGPAAPQPQARSCSSAEGAKGPRQVNVFGQPRLRASLRDLRSPRRLPKSSIEDDLKRLILMDNSCPEAEPAPALQRTLSDESLCGARRETPPEFPEFPPREFPKGFPRDFPGGGRGFLPEFPELFRGEFPDSPRDFPGSSTLPGRRGAAERGKGPVARLEPGLMPLPDAAGLEWATLVSAAKAYEVQRAVSLFSLTDPALGPEPPPPAPPPPERAPRGAPLPPPLPPPSPSPAPLDLPGKVSQLEAMLKQLHSDLEKEKQDKVFLQAEVANLRQNNRRLQQESSSAARQLRRFARIFQGTAEHPEP